MADALVFALSTEEVSGVLRYANENAIPVTPRGAGTNLVGSTIPLFGGIILDVSRMNRVLELDRDTMTVTVEPGMLLKDLQAYVEEHGLFYPPEPGEKASSIGGNISTNAGGMRAVKYGVTRDYVRGLEVVLADGTVLKVGGKQVKDASGLSLKHLLIGSEGTLGGYHQSACCAFFQAGDLGERARARLLTSARVSQRADHPAGERQPDRSRVHGAQGRSPR